MRRALIPILLLFLLTGCVQPLAEPDESLLGERAHATVGHDLYNRFGFELYQELNVGEDKNLLISPTSIALALSMTLNGADGETRRAMMETLHVADIDLQELNQQNQLLVQHLENSDVTISIANSLWMRQGIAFRQEFIEANQSYYDAEARDLDFDSPAAAETINGWVAEKTEGLIDKMVVAPIDPLTRLFLINAIYFQGDWSTPFNPDSTREDTFHTDQGAVRVPFMHQFGSLDYQERDGWQAVRLPYGEGSIAMYVFLPTELEQFSQQLNETNWQSWLNGFRPEQVQLHLPKFKFAYEQSLNDVLKSLGMSVAFAAEEADFHPMAEIDEDLYISEVKHKSFIEVDEAGTEAAAVTSVEVMAGGMPQYTELKIDRPFFFVIHDSQTGATLFLGSVLDPSPVG